jgi:hypothetical protein
MDVIDVIIGISIIIFLFIAGSIIISTIRRKGNWGINLKPINCPKCGAEASLVRKPKSMKEAFWGGSTCEKCGTNMDKWGKELV